MIKLKVTHIIITYRISLAVAGILDAHSRFEEANIFKKGICWHLNNDSLVGEYTDY